MSLVNLAALEFVKVMNTVVRWRIILFVQFVSLKCRNYTTDGALNKNIIIFIKVIFIY